MGTLIGYIRFKIFKFNLKLSKYKPGYKYKILYSEMKNNRDINLKILHSINRIETELKKINNGKHKQ